MADFAGLSDRGRKRANNQDAFRVDEDQGIFVLADGMGGHAAGEVAARLTVDSVIDFMERALGGRKTTWPFGYESGASYEYNLLKTAAAIANTRVCAEADKKAGHTGMGATLACLWLNDGRAHLCHVGDSRIYRFRDGELVRMTEDHSLVQDQIRAGLINASDARRHSLRHVVTRAVGSPEAFEADIEDRPATAGDLYLLCSDGLTDLLEDSRIAAVLQWASDLEDVCRQLVDAANEAGGDDNITVLLVSE